MKGWTVLPVRVVVAGLVAFAALAIFWATQGVWVEVIVSLVGALVCVLCARPAPPPAPPAPPPYDDGDYP